MIKSGRYYSQNATIFGWGEKSATLDKERIKLINQYLLGKKVLDIGCGTGLYVDYLASLGFDAYGVDFVDEFIQEAKKRKKGIFLKGKAEALPFKDKEFDTCLLLDILEHGDDLKILKETKRVCRKRILVIVPKKIDKELSNSGVIFRHFIDKTHLREYEDKDLESLSKNADLKLIHLEKIHPLYNETVFLALFNGSIFIKKIVRKLVFLILPKKIYPTEYFAVFEK